MGAGSQARLSVGYAVVEGSQKLSAMGGATALLSHPSAPAEVKSPVPTFVHFPLLVILAWAMLMRFKENKPGS